MEMEEQTIIINDLLSFLWCKGDVVPRERLLKSVKAFYSHQYASDALNSLLTSLPVEIEKANLNANPFVAILDVLEQLPKEQIPTLVCRNLNNVPDIENRQKELVPDVLKDEGIYTEHKRLVTELKSLNKSLFDLSKRLHSFSEKSSDTNNGMRFKVEETKDEDTENSLENNEESSSTRTDESSLANEELGSSLIANRYQRALARRVEKGKDLKVKKIKPLLLDPLENPDSNSTEGQIITSAPFYKIDIATKSSKKTTSFPEGLNKSSDNEDLSSALCIDEDFEDEEDFSDSMENEDDELTAATEGLHKTSNEHESGIGTSFRCPYCSTEFSSRDWLNHVPGCRGSEGTVNPEDFYCTKCDIYFASKKVLGFHMGLHDSARPFECHECKYRFYTQKSAASHTKMHFVDFRHKCPFCFFQAYKLSRVKEHIRSHTGEKPYKCPMCDYSTSSYTTLVRGHMHAHSNIRAFKCDQCEKCYKTKSKLQLHMRCHSTEKVYKCSVCGMGFSKSYKLTIHFKGHLTDKTYGCSKCDYITKKTAELRKHMKENH